MYLYAEALRFSFTGTNGPNPVPIWQYPYALSEVHKDMVYQDFSGRTWVSCRKPWPQPHWSLLGWIVTPTSLQCLTFCALVPEGAHTPTAMIKNVVETLYRRLEAVITTKGEQLNVNVHDFEMRCSFIISAHNANGKHTHTPLVENNYELKWCNWGWGMRTLLAFLYPPGV